MDRVLGTGRLPGLPEEGPHRKFLNWLLVAIQSFVAEIAFRLNEAIPKDGSELQQMSSLAATTPADISADEDNADFGFFAVIRITVTGADRALSGIINGSGPEGAGGRVITLMNVGAGNNLIVSHEDGGSSAANQFTLPRGFSVSIAPNMSMTFWYDLTDTKWRVA